MKAYIHALILLAAHFSFSAGSTPFASPREYSITTNPSGPADQDHCDCYLVSGPDPGYFQRYEFYDFRNVPLLKNPDASINEEKKRLLETDFHFGESVDRPDNIIQRLFGPDTILLSQTPFERYWKTQSWFRQATSPSPVTLANSQRNVFIARDPHKHHGPNSTLLILRTVRKQDHVSTAEIESTPKNLLHLSARIRLRIFAADLLPPSPGTNTTIPRFSDTRPPPRGACAGIFTYNSAICESDIEILTADPPSTIHYGNQPDYNPVADTLIPGASTIAQITIPWTTWSTHRLDWFPSISSWYHNDILVHSTRYSVPDKLSMFVINLWSDGGFWSGDLPLGQEVYLGVEWIELAYNVSSGNSNDPPVGKPNHRHSRPPLTKVRPDLGDEDGDQRGDEDRDGDDGKGNSTERACRRPCWVDDF